MTKLGTPIGAGPKGAMVVVGLVIVGEPSALKGGGGFIGLRLPGSSVPILVRLPSPVPTPPRARRGLSGSPWSMPPLPTSRRHRLSRRRRHRRRTLHRHLSHRRRRRCRRGPSGTGTGVGRRGSGMGSGVLGRRRGTVSQSGSLGSRSTAQGSGAVDRGARHVHLGSRQAGPDRHDGGRSDPSATRSASLSLILSDQTCTRNRVPLYAAPSPGPGLATLTGRGGHCNAQPNACNPGLICPATQA